MKVSYNSSGVNISEAELFVEKIKPLVRQTFSHNVLSGIGNFGAFYKFDTAKYISPVIVSSVDGVGTKLKIASLLKKYDTIGEDLINHCVNDIAVCGAKPLFFLDYYATGKLKSNDAFEIVKGIVRGCRANNCSLVGGETAEMPGIYTNGDFDLAGAIFGIVEKKEIVDTNKVKKGNVLIGIESSGLHTNGYSLVRRIFDRRKMLSVYYPEMKKTLGEELLSVHKSYLKIIQSSLKTFTINSISHITGGGIIGNTKRVIPQNLKIQISWNSWRPPFMFELIQQRGNVSENEMRKTFNLGIGLIFIVSESIVNPFIKFLKSKKEIPHIIGEIA